MKIKIVKKLTEAPIRDITPVGKNWGTGRGGFKKVDQKLLSNPKGIKKIRKQWEKTSHIFDMYLLNVPSLNKPEYKEYGLVKPNSDLALTIRLALGGTRKEDYDEMGRDEKLTALKQSFKTPMPKSDDAITILFNGNSGDQKVPMTGWIMAHRVGHAVSRIAGFGAGGRASRIKYQIPEFADFVNEVNYMFREAIKPYRGTESMQNVNPWSTNVEYSSSNKESARKQYLNIAQQIGTFKSARDRNIRNVFEFYHELFAQYLITGGIRFNTLPKSLVIRRREWGHEDRIYLQQDAEDWLEEANEFLESEAHAIGSKIQKVLDTMVGKTFLM
jgi:hypothetical protein